MTKKYCLDTSGISNPYQIMPPDIFSSLWEKIYVEINSGVFAATPEIYDELKHLPGTLGDVIRSKKSEIILDVDTPGFDGHAFIQNSIYLIQTYRSFISEYSGGSPKTVCLNDMSIIALAKTLELPVISEECRVINSNKKRKIPDICKEEQISHMSFNEYLRAEGISF